MMNLRSSFLFLLLLSLSAIKSADAKATLIPGDVVVRWHSRWDAYLERDTLANFKIKNKKRITDEIVLYRLDPATKETTQQALEILNRDKLIKYAEANYRAEPTSLPNDPLLQYQWNLRTVDMTKAWDISTGDNRAVIAVIDSGIIKNHPDLRDRLLPGYDFVSNSSYEGDNQAGPDNDPEDTRKTSETVCVETAETPQVEETQASRGKGLHGTQMAGILGATSNNNKFFSGADQKARILPVRVIGTVEGSTGGGADVANGILWAIGATPAAASKAPINPNPAQVINLSLVTGSEQVVTDALAEADKRSVIIVAAAGNGCEESPDVGCDLDTQETKGSKIYPAMFPNACTIGATDRHGDRAAYSNFGTKVDLMAPGGAVDPKSGGSKSSESTGSIPVLSYKTVCLNQNLSAADLDKNAPITLSTSGTSPAAALVSGVMSLMLSLSPNLNSSQACRILQQTADPSRGQCLDHPGKCGAGELNAWGALYSLKYGKNPDKSLYHSQETVFGGICAFSTESSTVADGLTCSLAVLLFLTIARRRSAISSR